MIAKARNAGNFTIKFMHAALNKEAYSGEIFIEFQETLRVCTLIAQMEEHGACQVNVVTFKNNESASNALLRVWTSAAKTGCEVTRGAGSKELLAKTQAKFEAESQSEADDVKNEAKMSEGIRQSLTDMRHKVGSMEEKIDTVQQGVCANIPDYQKMLKETLAKLVDKTKEAEMIWEHMETMTREINQLTTANKNLKEMLTCSEKEKEITKLKTIIDTKDRQIKSKDDLIEAYKTFETAKWIIETEQELKRARC